RNLTRTWRHRVRSGDGEGYQRKQPGRWPPSPPIEKAVRMARFSDTGGIGRLGEERPDMGFETAHHGGRALQTLETASLQARWQRSTGTRRSHRPASGRRAHETACSLYPAPGTVRW